MRLLLRNSNGSSGSAWTKRKLSTSTPGIPKYCSRTMIKGSPYSNNKWSSMILWRMPRIKKNFPLAVSMRTKRWLRRKGSLNKRMLSIKCISKSKPPKTTMRSPLRKDLKWIIHRLWWKKPKLKRLSNYLISKNWCISLWRNKCMRMKSRYISSTGGLWRDKATKI